MTIQLQTRAEGTLTVALLLTLTSSGAWGSAQGSLEVPEPNEQISSTTAAKSSPDEENLRSASGAADPTSREQTDDEAFAEDTAKVAARKGWSLEEAQERLRHQDDFGTLSAHFRRQYPEIYAAAKVVHGKDSTRYIARFVGAVPEDARTKAEQLGIDVTFLDDAPASEVELQHRADGIVEDLASTRFKSFTMGARAIDGVIAGTLTRPPEHRGQDGRSDSELRKELPKSARAQDVVISFTDGSMENMEVLGGGRMRKSQTGETCTSGFVIRHDDVPRGVTTAAHCGPAFDQYVNPESGEPPYAAELLGRCWNGDECKQKWGDFQWHRTSKPHKGFFYYTSTNLRRRVTTVFSRFHFDVGQTYCGFGRKSNVSDCADVLNPETTCTSASGSIGRQVLVDADWMIKGDSGGPWFWGRKAAGTTSVGGTLPNGESAVCFSKAALMVRTPMSIDVVARDRKVRGETMNPGSSIWSPNGQYELRMQTDGNLVVYGPGCPGQFSSCWATSWYGVPSVAGSFARMHKAGNFAHRHPNGSAHWSTPVHPWGNKILMQDDGNLVVYTKLEQPRWATSCASGGVGPCPGL